MAPKRSAGSAHGPATKKVKAVADAVAASGSFPSEVVAMVGAAVPGTLGVPPESRDSIQKAFVEMVGQVLAGQETIKKNQLADAAAKSDKAFEVVAEAEAEKKRLGEAITANEEDITAKTAKTGDDAASVSSCKENLHTAEKSQETFEKEMAHVKKDREAIGKVMSEDFVVIKDGPPTDKRIARGKISSVTKAIAKYEADEALVAAFPSSLGKGLEERGAFDNMLIDHVGKLLDEHLQKLDGKIATSEQDAANLAAAVDSARQALDAATSEQTATHEALKAAQDEHKRLKAELKANEKKGKELAGAANKAELEKSEAELSVEELADVLSVFASQRDGAPAEP